MALLLSFLFTISKVNAAPHCAIGVGLSGFNSKPIAERARLAGYQEYVNLFKSEKERQFPKSYKSFQKATLQALQFKNTDGKKVTLVMREAGELIAVFEGEKEIYCEKAE